MCIVMDAWVGLKPDDRAVLVIEPSSLLVSLWKLQPFFTPQPLDFLVIDLPAFDVKQFSDLAIAISAVLLRQPDQSKPQRIIISPVDAVDIAGSSAPSRSPGTSVVQTPQASAVCE